jgi:hypothetical protein
MTGALFCRTDADEQCQVQLPTDNNLPKSLRVLRAFVVQKDSAIIPYRLDSGRGAGV